MLVADGWGGAFASLQVRRFDATSGKLLASVRTRTPVRAFGSVDATSTYFLANSKVFVHDAIDLSLRATYDQRVPRYSNAIARVGPDAVVLSTPRAMVELELRTGRARRVAAVPALALARIGKRNVAVLSDGAVLARSDRWERLGAFQTPQGFAYIDGERGDVVSLSGSRPSPYDDNGTPQSITSPTSRELHLAHLAGDAQTWNPRTLELPFAAHAVGFVGRWIVAVSAMTPQLQIASLDRAASNESWKMATVAGAFVGFAGAHGIVSGVSLQNHDATLSLHVPDDSLSAEAG